MNEIKDMNQYYQQQYQASIAKPNNKGKTGFILGLISIILLPVFYNPFMLWIVWLISIFGLVYSIKGLRVAPKELAIAGLVLSAIPIASHFIMWFISDMIAYFA